MMYAELSQAADARSAVMSSRWRPIPTETSAGGCSSRPRAKLGMTNETWGRRSRGRSLRKAPRLPRVRFVVGEILPEHGDVVGVAERDAVPGHVRPAAGLYPARWRGRVGRPV